MLLNVGPTGAKTEVNEGTEVANVKHFPNMVAKPAAS